MSFQEHAAAIEKMIDDAPKRAARTLLAITTILRMVDSGLQVDVQQKAKELGAEETFGALAAIEKIIKERDELIVLLAEAGGGQ